MASEKMEWIELLSTERLRDGATVSDASDPAKRSPFARDFDRIAYSTPFRRLQNKTQFTRFPTECAQAATLAHDIGNPPFGHPGEGAIRDWFKNENPNTLVLTNDEVRNFTEFNGNAQGFRILTQYPHGYNSMGLQLTCATLAAFTKYPMSSSIPWHSWSKLPTTLPT